MKKLNPRRRAAALKLNLCRREAALLTKSEMVDLIDYGCITPSLTTGAIAARMHLRPARVGWWLREFRRCGWIPEYSPANRDHFHEGWLEKQRRKSVASTEERYRVAMAGQRYENVPFTEAPFAKARQADSILTLTGCTAAMCAGG